MLNYRSVVDLNQALQDNLHRLPRDIDVVVGISRSGMLLANLLALHLHRPLTDLDGFLENRLISEPRRSTGTRVDCRHARRPLIVADRVSTGGQMKTAKRRLERIGIQLDPVFMAAYGSPRGRNTVDLVLEEVPDPRIFEWNLFDHDIMRRSCMDIDGVLCMEPTREESDDGPRYESFLLSAPALRVPTRKIGWLVTSRLEKYRSQTEDWLARTGIRYSELLMLDLRDGESGTTEQLKGRVYRDLESPLLIEGKRSRARAIATTAGKPVLSLQTNQMIHPSMPAAVGGRMRRVPQTARHHLETNMGTLMRRWFGAPQRLFANQ